MILKVFVFGMLSTFPVLILNIAVGYSLSLLGVPFHIIMFVSIVFVAAITEELAKYLVIKFSVLKSPDCDEPTDLMIYAITAAMGFAAIENVIFLFPGKEVLFGSTSLFLMQEIFTGSLIRFVSGTFLHALTAGVMGYFLALSIKYSTNGRKIILAGLGTAALLHGLYNFSIIMVEKDESFFLMAPIILITLFVVVFICFSKTRKMASICNLDNGNTKKN